MALSVIPASFSEELRQPLIDGFSREQNSDGVVQVSYERGRFGAELAYLPFYQSTYTIAMILLTEQQVSDFWNWHDTTLSNGTLPFLWNFTMTDDLLITEGLFDLSSPPQIQPIRINTNGQQAYRITMTIYGRDTVITTDALPEDIRELLGDISYEDFGLILDALNRAIPAVSETNAGLNRTLTTLSQ